MNTRFYVIEGDAMSEPKPWVHNWVELIAMAIVVGAAVAAVVCGVAYAVWSVTR
jgi:hypothetical protein